MSDQNSTPLQKSPLDIFNESYDRAKKQFDDLKLPEAVWHKLIACRTDLTIAFQQLQFIHPSDKVKLHDKIADAQLMALKLG